MKRRRLLVNGIVQGVGFRPFVVQTAMNLGLAGHVCNSSAGVVIEVEGPADRLDRFAGKMQNDSPPLAQVTSFNSDDIPPLGSAAFEILSSENTPGTSTMIPPDAATCSDCLRELRDPTNRRHGYPFTNCTNCGPRWTIIGRIPYDRPHTSMAPFVMCTACQKEYDDLQDRRFHAQPNACPDCGPRVWLKGPLGATAAEGTVLEQAAEAVARHAVVAIRGLGGFHLAVRADAEAAVDLLRHRKKRAAKPLAVMVADLPAARQLAELSAAEAALLQSPVAPIVLVKRRDGAGLAANVAPGHRRLGLMLPSTPLHHLFLDALGQLGINAVVMTSGNVSDEPICMSNDEAQERLANIADAFVLHDREILRRADDSVMQMVGEAPLVMRRSRGLAPVPVSVPVSIDGPATAPILAVGTQLKNTVCILQDGRAFLSPHIGDLGQVESDRFFRESIATLQGLLECAPLTVAHDLHPGYAATIWASEQARLRPELKLVPVQHHHAHLAAVLAEHRHPAAAVGLIMDGTGYGEDGTIWGGEILFGGLEGFARLGHFEGVPLPGAEAAIRAPWRQAVSYLRHAYGSQFFAKNPNEFPFQGDRPVAPVLEILERDLNSPLTSSCGRLFDAVAAMVGPWSEVGYEAQAAIELAALTTAAQVRAVQPFSLAVNELHKRLAQTDTNGPLLLPVATVIKSVREARRAGVMPGVISAMFHRTLIEILALTAGWAAAKNDTAYVVLAGGVFQNEILLGELEQRLRQDGLHPLRPLNLPPGDGAVSLGQAAIAAALSKERQQ